MRSTGKIEWEKYIGMIVDNVNNSHLDAIGGFAPAEIDEETEWKVRNALEKRKKPFLDWKTQEENVKKYESEKHKINLGDYVYKIFQKDALGKGYDTQAGRLFIVKRILASKNPVRYELVDLKGAKVAGSYYKEQLVLSPTKPTDGTYWLIRPQKKFKERVFNGRKQIYVSWLFYPANEGEWIDKADVASASKINEKK
jgi:hypothetical protein